MNLVEKAKQTQNPDRGRMSQISDERVALAVAWISGEVTWFQAKAALELKQSKSGNAGQYLGPALREAYRRGLLVKAGH